MYSVFIVIINNKGIQYYKSWGLQLYLEQSALTVPVHGGDDNVVQSPRSYSLSRVGRLTRVKRGRGTGGLHGAKSTPPGTLVPQYLYGESVQHFTFLASFNTCVTSHLNLIKVTIP